MAWSGWSGQPGELAVPFGKERDASGVPVQEVAVSDRPDLALCKEPRDGNRSQKFRGRSRIMVRPSKEPPTTAATAEHEGAERRMPMAGSVGRQQRVQIFRR